jgi:hypothetical protein
MGCSLSVSGMARDGSVHGPNFSLSEASSWFPASLHWCPGMRLSRQDFRAFRRKVGRGHHDRRRPGRDGGDQLEDRRWRGPRATQWCDSGSRSDGARGPRPRPARFPRAAEGALRIHAGDSDRTQAASGTASGRQLGGPELEVEIPQGPSSCLRSCLAPTPSRRPGNPQFPFPRFPIWPGNGEGNPRFPTRPESGIGNPRFPIGSGTGIGVPIGRKSGNRGYPSV